MALTTGARFGPYEVLALLGAGGMGEVYRATDTKLKRQVAIKVLPDSLVADPDRLARFQREAEVLASVNHPNIATVYGLEEKDNVNALVMELVEGPTLADRIAKGPVALDEALLIARQIADALDGAHERGIIHRDLKPANIKLRDDGAVKVLDFGLAKALEGPGGAGAAGRAGGTINPITSPTLTSPAQMTGVGVILGTAAYMAPEQARGRPVDRRADIWAFGCVLYEMLTARRAFPGDDITDTIVAVVSKEPDWAPIPVRVRRVLQACLQKDPRKRLRDVADVWQLLDGGPDHSVPRAETTRSRRRALAPWLLSGVLAAGLGAFAWLYFSQTPAETRPVRFQIPSTDDMALRDAIALSPDGAMLAFSAVGTDNLPRIWVRNLASADLRPLPGTQGVTNRIFWSPDSRFKLRISSPPVRC